MGNSKSRDAEQQHADKIIKCLKIHETNVKGLAHTVQAHKAYVDLLMYDVSKICPDTEGRFSKENEDTADQRICHHCTSRWQTNTRKLLGNIQNSLECQSDYLLTSFESLNVKIHRTIKAYKLDTGSSVDELYETNSIIYEESLQNIQYEKCLRHASDEINQLKDSEKKLEEEKRRLLEANINTVKRLKGIEDSLKRCCGNIESLADQKETLEQKFEQEEILEQKFEQKETVEQTLEQNETLVKVFDRNEAFEQVCDQKSTQEHMVDQKQTLEQKLTEIEFLAEKINADKENLEHRLEYLKEHRPVSVQLIHQVKGSIVDKMLDELKSLLVDQMGMKRQELQFIVCTNETDVNPDLPLLVICMKASRLGTDISTAIEHLTVSSNVAVLIFHHNDLHALPKQTSSRVLTGPEFKSLGGIFDIAFLAEKGIYPCDMNTKAAIAIDNFIKMKHK